MITAINIMLSIMGCSNGNGDSESEADVVVDTNDVDGIVVVLVKNNGDADDDDDDTVDSSFVTCDSEAIVRFGACDPISSKFKCSMQIDKYWLGAVFTPPCRCTDHKQWFPMFEYEDKKRRMKNERQTSDNTTKIQQNTTKCRLLLVYIDRFWYFVGVLLLLSSVCMFNVLVASSMTSFEWFENAVAAIYFCLSSFAQNISPVKMILMCFVGNHFTTGWNILYLSQ